MTEDSLSFGSLASKTVVVHTVTYFLCGVLAFLILDYESRFAEPAVRTYMRQASEPLVMAGPLLQPIRGLLFAIAFYPLRSVLFGQKKGWLAMWLVLVMVGVFSTFGPSPGSVEGLIYTVFPVRHQFFGLFEVLAQSLLLSVILCRWVNQREGRWLGRVLWTAFGLVIGISILGLLVGPRG